jgi:hypothetical protein
MSTSGQKFIGRNRAPRVQIEYEVEVYGAEKTIQLPFVMGVMADLMGSPEAEPPKVNERKFLEINVDNFDDRLKAMKPRAAFQWTTSRRRPWRGAWSRCASCSRRASSSPTSSPTWTARTLRNR